MQNSDSGEAMEYAAQNLLYVVPYNNPWCWMNDQAVHYTDEIRDVLREHYGLSDQIGVVSTGGSMGGLSALVYTANSRTTPIACVANCPVCDLPYHFTEREDLPRTLYSAYGNEEGESLEDVLRLHSPVHMVDRMPRIPYTVLHCEKDTRVNLERHSELFVKLMEEAKQVAYDAIMQSLTARRQIDRMQLKRQVKDDMTKFLYAKTKRKPMILPVIMNV